MCKRYYNKRQQLPGSTKARQREKHCQGNVCIDSHRVCYPNSTKTHPNRPTIPLTLPTLPPYHLFQPIVYTLRTSTGSRRGSALSEPNTGLMVCLISADGSATLQRLAPLSDSTDTAQLLKEICSTVGPDSGANCVASLASVDKIDTDDNYSFDNAAIEASQQQQQQDSSSASNDSSNNNSKQKARRHFQEGNIDEFCFLSPDLGPLSSIIIGPESGSWYCEEINVSCSSTGHTDRFVCRDVLGGKDRPAAFLTPIPPGSVVYGSGDAALLLTKEQADRMQKVNMQGYDYLKMKLLTTTASLTALGGVGAYAIGGVDLAAPLLMGGAVGLVYQAALQKSIDGLGNNNNSISNNNKTIAEEYYSKPRVGSEMQQSREMVLRIVLGNPFVRMVAVASCLGGLFVLLQVGGRGGEEGGVSLSSLGSLFTSSKYSSSSSSSSDNNQAQVKQAVALCSGFLMNKVAVLAVAASSPPPSSVGLWVKDRMDGKDDKSSSSKSADRVDQ